MNLRISSILSILLLGSTLQAATLTLTTKYGATGGLAGNFNNVGDQVNGRNICPAVNDYNNGTAGCDMSGDAGYSDNGTGDPSDDSYSGDLIVRTNDSFEAVAKYSWLGNAGGDEEQVTISGVLPAGKGFIWDGIPGSCDQTLSTLSEDKKNIDCVRKDFDTNDVGSYSEQMTFSVKVEGDAVNGSIPGDITFSIKEPTGTAGTLTDGVEDGNSANLLKVTASPRWNIDKHDGPGYYTTSYGVNDADGNPGWYLWYNFTIEVDEVPGETDDPINPSLGNEALKGGTNATVTFTDDLSNISPNAKLVTWDTNGNFSPTSNACDMDNYTNSDEPFPYLNTTYPDRSIPLARGTMGVTCTQTGTTVAVEVTGIDGTLTNAPIRSQNGTLLPVNRNIAAIGVLRVFVPLSDVEAGEDGIVGNDDDGTLSATNCLTNFNPVGISDGTNFNGLGESEADNCRNITLYATRGSWSKSYRKGWSDQSNQISQWGGGSWALPPTDGSIVRAGDATATPGSVWGTYTVYTNTGGTDIENPAICDVIDVETYKMVLLDATTDNSATFVDDTKHAVDLNYGTTETVPNIKVEYATGYVGTWPPAPDAPAGLAVARECNATDITWYPDLLSAEASGQPVSKVRLSAPTLPVQKLMAMRIKHEARSTYLTSGDPIPNNKLLVNYATYKSALTDNKYVSINYQPNDASINHIGGWSGDRLIMERAKVRVLKEMLPTAVSPGSEVTVKLTPSFTTDGSGSESSNVQIVDVLPNGLSYKNGTTIGSYGTSFTPYGEPQVISPATDATCNTYAAAIVAKGHPCATLNGGTGKESILVWDLGSQTTGTVYSDLNLTAIVTVDAPAGVLANYVQIESPADDSVASKRVDNANVSNSVPSSLLIVKSVQTPLHEINKDGLLNWMEFRVGLRNGASTPLTELDIIDVLPFNGDGVEGSFTFTPLPGTTVARKRDVATNFNGAFQFDSMSFDENGQCNARGISYWFTKQAGPLDISPLHASNTKADGTPETIWCEGTTDGPDAGCGFTDAEVTAVRTRGVSMTASGTCFVNLKFATDDNNDNDIYSNTAASTAIAEDGSKLDAVLSNTVSAKVYASSIGDKVWYDRDADGIQDEGETAIGGVTVKLYKDDGTLLSTTITAADGTYGFKNLLNGDYIIEFIKPVGYLVTTKGSGGDQTLDSNINTNGKTDIITLGEDEENPTIDAGFFSPIISGNIFSDGNGDNTINGTKISTVSEEQLHATLLAEDGTVLATKPIAVSGSYEFDGEDGVLANKNYSVVLSTVSGTTIPKLPDTWNNADGEHIGTAVGTDGQNAQGEGDGKIVVNLLEENVPEVNFGINEKPVAQDKTEAPQLNPGADVKVSVPDLNVTDREDGTPTTITITTLPTNGKLYYNGNLVTVNEAIENADPSKFTVDPDNGDQTVMFNYTTTDKVGVVSDEATVTMPFRGLKISGNIFDDGSGDDTINGTKISSPDSKQLYATLLNGDGAVLATKAISSGAYSFNGDDGIKPNSSYTVVLSTEANATEAKLPTDWNHADGEHIGTTEGTDGDADGSISVSVEGVDVPEVNFGINNKPTAVDKAEPTQANPGKDNQVVVPTLSIADKEDGTPTTITITTVPTNGKLYYDGDEVNAGDTLTDFDPSKFTVDPDNGDQTLEFKYTATDRAGVVSDEAKVTLPFTDIAISGKLFDDGNANGNVDGNLTAKADDTQLYVTLVDTNGDAVASKPLGADGTYIFSNVDGVTPNTNYTMVLSDEANRTTPKLPENWNNADGENIGLNGLDRDANGIVTVNVASTHIPEINFGINKKPVADDKTEPTQFNPGSDVQVSVPTLTVSDKEDGTPAIVTIRTLPTNATLYYDGAEVTVDMEIADLTLLTVNPDDGDQTVLFTYTSTDVTGMVSNPATVTIPFKGIKIAGNIFNDGNADGTVNGTPIASPNGTQLHATLLDVNGTAIATTPIAEDGTYSFGNKDGVLPNHSYSVVLSTTANSNEASLPVNWNNADGEHIGTNTGLDDAPDGVINVTVVEKDVVEVNFGINKKPVAGDNTGELQLNPGTDVQVNVIDLNVSDSEDTTPSTVTIKTVPSNGTLYYDGVEVVANQVIENFDNSKLTLDPNNGSLTVSFTYTTTDGSGVESDIATIAMPFKGLKISGNIFNDGNNNGTVDGDLTSKADEVALYAVLLDSNGNFMAREAIKADGSYDFDGLDGIVPNSTYNVVLTSDANGTTAMLPTTWTNADGEHIGADAGLDRVADGEIEVVVTTKDIPEINFGINKRPVADDKTEPEQLNTSRDAQYVVPTLTVSDKEDGVPAVITIRTLPTNGTLYYEGTPVELNATIADPSKLTIDPDDGDQNVTFTYTSTDVTGAISDPATVVMPFVGVKISGYIFADGNNDETVNGTQIATVDGVQLYATLLNENNETLATVAIDSNGSYLFENKDGVYPNNNYHVVLSTEANATTAKLPENWNHADGEHIGRDKGLDDSANGVIDVSVVTTDVPEVNFGINKRPVVEDVTSVVQANPGADKQIKVIDLGIIDNEDGSPKTVTIVSLPTDGTLYYDGVAVEKGQIIPNFNNKLLTVDPKNGATKIEFDYTTTDNTGWESEKARATMPFAAVAPSENFTAEDDAQPASLEGPVTTINVLDNDALGAGSIIHLLDTNNGTILWNDGTAVGSATINTQDSVVVPGEGVWTVNGDTVVFTAEEGFTGIPTPIYYVVEDNQGNQTNAAQVAIISNCVCDTYENSVSALNPWWMLVGMFFISILGALFARREFEELK